MKSIVLTGGPFGDYNRRLLRAIGRLGVPSRRMGVGMAEYLDIIGACPWIVAALVEDVRDDGRRRQVLQLRRGREAARHRRRAGRGRGTFGYRPSSKRRSAGTTPTGGIQPLEAELEELRP